MKHTTRRVGWCVLFGSGILVGDLAIVVSIFGAVLAAWAQDLAIGQGASPLASKPSTGSLCPEVSLLGLFTCSLI